MTFMRWSKNFITGIPVIDEQHQGLVNMINQAAPVLLDETANHHDKIDTLLTALLQYADVHFKTEQDIMVKNGIDPRHLQHHIQSHQGFARQVLDLKEQLDHHKTIKNADLLKFLSNWLVFHILDEDQRMARQIHAIAQGSTPASIYDQTEGPTSNSHQGIHETLITALVDLFALLTEQNRLLAEKNKTIAEANEELKQHRLSLETQIQSRAQELAIAKEAAEQASMAKSRFLGVISHELLTPLHVITGFIHLLTNEPLSDEQQEKISQINRSTQQLTTLLKEVIHYARLDAGEINIQKAPFSPRSIIRYLSDWAEKQCQKKNLQLNVNLDETLPICSGDEKLITQTLEILISNAIKFTQQGSITLQATLLQQTASEIQMAFDVIDTGIGNSIARRHGGVGLGLVVCTKMVELMGGTLEFDSTPNEGSRFRIILNLPLDQSTLLNNITLNGVDDLQALQLMNQLHILSQMLEENDMQARNVYHELHPCLKDIVPASELDDLTQRINSYDFELALLQINRMIQS